MSTSNNIRSAFGKPKTRTVDVENLYPTLPADERTNERTRERLSKGSNEAQNIPTEHAANEATQELSNVSTYEVPNEPGIARRQSFGLYSHQIEGLNDYQYLYRKRNGKTIEKEEIVRQAIDEYLSRKFRALQKGNT